MHTPWGELPVADAHVHFFSHRFFTLLTGEKPDAPLDGLESRLGWSMPDPDPVAFARRWVGELDRHGVSRAALIASLPGDADSVLAAVAAFPGRFYGYAMVNPCEPAAAERVEGLLATGHLRAVCLFPAMHRYPIGDDRALAVIARCAARPGTLVFVHCGALSVGVRAKLGMPSLFDLRYSNPVDLHPVALANPGVRFVIPHFGAGYFREALMLCDLCENVSLDTSSSNSWIRYLLPPSTLEEVFRRALDVAGARRLMFGTDSSFFPRGWHRAVFDHQAGILRACRVSEEDARAILGGNLLRS